MAMKCSILTGRIWGRLPLRWNYHRNNAKPYGAWVISKRATGVKRWLIWPAAAIGGTLPFAAVVWAGSSIGYLLDDWLHLVLARALPDPFYLFTHDCMLGAFFRPLGTAWWWWLSRIGDPEPTMRHLIAAGLYLTGAIMIGLAVRAWRDDGRVGLTAAVLWLASPIGLSGLCWFSCAYDLLAVALAGLALWRGLRFIQYGWKPDLFFAGLAAMLAMWSKESALILPAVLLLLAWSAEFRQTRRTGVMTGIMFAIAMAVLIHRHLILGVWIGGYLEIEAPLSLSMAMKQALAALQEQAPGLFWRWGLLLTPTLILILHHRSTRRAAILGLAALAIAALPAITLMSSPSMLPVLPARYLVFAAAIGSFPLALVIVEDKKISRVGLMLIFLLILEGATVAFLGAKTTAKRAFIENSHISNVLTQAQALAADGQILVEQPTPRAVGVDAGVKALDRFLLPRIIVLNCGIPTHVVTTPEMARRLDLPWSRRMPHNPSQGFGLIWGEVWLPRERCGAPLVRN